MISINHYFSCGVGADSDGESGPMMQLNRGFHAMRGGSAYGRGHMGVNPSFPLGYVRGDANAAWEVMSDEGRGTGLNRREDTYALTLHFIQSIDNCNNTYTYVTSDAVDNHNLSSCPFPLASLPLPQDNFGKPLEAVTAMMCTPTITLLPSVYLTHRGQVQDPDYDQSRSLPKES